MDVARELLLSRARELVEPLRARAAQPEELRHVPRESVEAIVDAQLMRIATPRKFGGLDVPYATMLEAAVILGSGCGSTGWCYALWAVDSWIAGLFPLAAQEQIFETGPDVLISGTYNPMAGRLTHAPGGYRLTGHWEFASGCHWCAWIFLGCRGPDNDVMWVALPRADVEIVDTWHVLGLRGTSSNDIVVDNLFVPTHRTVRVSDVAAGGPDSQPWQIHHQARYWLPFRSILVWDLVAPGIGIARAAIEEFTRRFSQRRGVGRSAEAGSVQLRDATAVAHRDRLVLDFGGDNFARLSLGLEPVARMY